MRILRNGNVQYRIHPLHKDSAFTAICNLTMTILLDDSILDVNIAISHT